MNYPSIPRLGLLSAIGRGESIDVEPVWVCEHAVLVHCGLADLDFEDESAEAGLEIVFEPDFSLDDEDDDEEMGIADEVLALLEQDEDDEDEDDFPP